ncbi:type VII secretion protein EccB [Gordonia sp. CPCC 206044]|uniref:type VII secretion protein EccB n=1 Tax=Gordonia sp. CPCC 206044 TaxID=3140793 RepID=UPI003AF3B794
MVRQLTTRAQVNGYRFLVRRLEHALVRRDVRMLHDPMRTHLQALVVSAVIGLLVLGGFGVWGLIRPQGSVGDAKILVSKGGGGTYVVLDDTVHPVLNLASARLITGGANSPRSVSDGTLAGYPRGPVLGIPGAPGSLAGSAHPGESAWTVCDTAVDAPTAAGSGVELTVIAQRPHVIQGIDVAGADDAVLVVQDDVTFLVYTVARDGVPVSVRARVDTASVPVMRALGLEGAVARPISAGVLNSFPEVEPLTVPVIDGRGAPASAALDGVPVGSVVKTVGVDDRITYYVVLSGGVQRVGSAGAEILRLGDPDGAAAAPILSPGQIAAVPVVDTLPIGEFPVRTPRLVDAENAGTICRSWRRGTDDAPATTGFLLGRRLPLPSDAIPVRVSTADGSGPGVDRVYLRPGSGEYLQATGSEPDSTRAESRFYVSDVGVRFGVADAGAGQMLGLGDRPKRAPWSVIGLLAPGPVLSRTAALVSHDGIAPDRDARSIPAPGS